MRYIAVVLLATTVLASDLQAQTGKEPRAAAPAFQQFERAVAAYARLHHELNRKHGSLPVSADAASAERAIESRADVIRRARPEPRQGEIFTRELAAVIRRQIADALRARRLTSADVMLDEAAEGNEGPVMMRLNAPFPWQGAEEMPLCITDALPLLPEELQYRFVDRNLVLVDMVAGLIVDILPQALPSSGRAR